ncbi:MAG: M23 family metallopeptidase [Dongiaceae bacterium]
MTNELFRPAKAGNRFLMLARQLLAKAAFCAWAQIKIEAEAAYRLLLPRLLSRNSYAVSLVAALLLLGAGAPPEVEPGIKLLAPRLSAQLSVVEQAVAALPNGDHFKELADLETSEGPELAKATTRTLKVGKGDRLYTMLRQVGLSQDEAQNVLNAIRKVYDPHDLQIGQELTLVLLPVIPLSAGAAEDKMAAAQFDLESLRFRPSAERELVLNRKDKGVFSAVMLKRELKTKLALAEGKIGSSFSQSASRAGIPRSVYNEMVRAMSYDVDFQRDIRSNDRFEAIFEQVYDDRGRFIRTGNLVYGALRLSGKEHKMFRYISADDGRADFYDEKGRSVRKALLRTPIAGGRITAGFGMRNHPILGFSRMHTGIDFAANVGTPVIAAGDGVVVQKNWNGGYGHYVEIRHNPTYATAYAHLSRYAKTLKVGQRVRQGDVIGYVGTTGMSTGPHLHYEVHKNAAAVNPMGVKFPTGRQLAGKELQKFKTVRLHLENTVAQLQQKSLKLAMR